MVPAIDKKALLNRAVILRPGRSIALILALGLILRLALLVTPRAYAPDEIYQYLEPAYRLVFGHGIVTWEYHFNVRSWLVPLAIAIPMAVGQWLAPNGMLYLLLPKLLLVATSLTMIVTAALIGKRTSPIHGIFAGFVVATWYEYIYFATQMLTDGIAVTTFLGAAAILYKRKPSPQWIAIAGALIGFTLLIRFQYGPAVVVFAIVRTRAGRHSSGALAIGTLAALAIEALIDCSMGQMPFAWLFQNVRENIINGRSHLWVDGPGFYLDQIAAAWGAWLVPLILLVWLGSKHYPALALIVVVNIVCHTLIAHKEYRYILLSTMVLVLLAALGTVDAAGILARLIGPGARRRVLLFFAGGWLVASSTIAASHRLSSWWVAGTPQLIAFSELRNDPALCGMAIQDLDWSATGGYTYLHRNIPLYVYDGIRGGDGDVPDNGALFRERAGFNTIFALSKGGSPVPPEFRKLQCYKSESGFRTGVCVYRREGPCAADVAMKHELNRTLVRRAN